MQLLAPQVPVQGARVWRKGVFLLLSSSKGSILCRRLNRKFFKFKNIKKKNKINKCSLGFLLLNIYIYPPPRACVKRKNYNIMVKGQRKVGERKRNLTTM